MSKFQLALLVFFGACILIAVIVFSFVHKSGTTSAHVTVWGDIPAVDFNTFMNNAGYNNDSTLVIQYVEKPSTTFDADFTEALAEGTGPDLTILAQDKIFKQKNKLYLIPSANISAKDFTSIFAEEGNLFATGAGTYALPLTIDPLVLYFNRDLLTKASIALPPAYWDQIYDYAEKLTTKDNAGNITKSAIALGESSNIPHSKEILATLMLQAGTPITDFQGTALRSELLNNFGLPIAPAQSALDFYTQFSDPAKPFYSWNRSLLSAQTNFISGDSAMYIGFASELKEIKAKNPTLNLGVTTLPQSRVSGKAITFGHMEGVAIVKNSLNAAAAYTAALKLSSSASMTELSNILGVPPARSALLSVKPSDLAGNVFYGAAIQSKGWIDPDDIKTRTVFMNMIQSVTSGRARTVEALGAAEDQINALSK
jgi:ABC-type glycerol-3-phosphate transport system substrate-binding protein